MSGTSPATRPASPDQPVPWLTEIIADHLCAADALEELEKAKRIVSDLLQAAPGDAYHDEIAGLLSRFSVVKHQIRSSMVG